MKNKNLKEHGTQNSAFRKNTKYSARLLFCILYSVFCLLPSGGGLSLAQSSQQTTEAQQIQTLRGQLDRLKKDNKENIEYMEREIDGMNLSVQDLNKLLETHDIRIMTNKLLMQGIIEGTLAQIRAREEETYEGYSRTRKIVWAALAAGAVAFMCFIFLLTLFHRRNRKEFYLYNLSLTHLKTEMNHLEQAQEKDAALLKEDLNELRHGLDISDDRHQQAMLQTQLRIANIETTAKALHKEADERASSLAHFQQETEDSIDKTKQYMLGAETILKKEMRDMEHRLAELIKQSIVKETKK
ncbi:MAG: hypothetical protein HY841_04950 [Bacteroidetes bacterium]|nr:hypothetical protein [Bacteroidota bacterium]